MRRLLPAFALGLLLAGSVYAIPQSSPVAIGSDGTTYRLWTGTFGEIFGANPVYAPETPVLALDVIRPGEPLARYLVPGTEGAESESSAVLLNDPVSGSVHLIWNRRTYGNQVWSRFEMRSFTPAGWSEATEISGGTLTDKDHLQVALVNDDFRATIDGAEVRVPRRVLHLVWSESSGGEIRSYYTPVVFVAGNYLGWNPVVALDSLAADEETSAILPPAELQATPRLVGTSGGKTTVVFVHSATHRLVFAELSALPGEIGQLAEMARGHIVELAQALPSTDRAELAEMARGHIVELASRFHSSAAAYLGSRTAALLLAAPPDADAGTLSEMARGHIVELGREILSGGLANVCADEGGLLEIPPLVPVAGSDFSHFLALRRSGSIELPADIAPGQRLLSSVRGDLSIIAWEVPGQILYRESATGGGWSELRSIDLTQVPANEAWNALTRRASGL
ncbi:MAG: hypothetical protein AB7G12_09975 [Thermoanaerobaculia bacterium]